MQWNDALEVDLPNIVKANVEAAEAETKQLLLDSLLQYHSQHKQLEELRAKVRDVLYKKDLAVKNLWLRFFTEFKKASCIIVFCIWFCIQMVCWPNIMMSLMQRMLSCMDELWSDSNDQELWTAPALHEIGMFVKFKRNLQKIKFVQNVNKIKISKQHYFLSQSFQCILDIYNLSKWSKEVQLWSCPVKIDVNMIGLKQLMYVESEE